MDKSDLLDKLKNKKFKSSSFFSGFLLFILDTIVLLLSISLSFFIINLFFPTNINFRSFINYAIFLPIFLLLFTTTNLYPGISIPTTEEIEKFFKSIFLGFVIIFITILFSEIRSYTFSDFILNDSEDIFVCLAFLLLIPLATILLTVFREIFRNFISKSSFWGVSCIVYISNSDYTVVDRLLKNKKLGYKPILIINSSIQDNSNDVQFYKNIPIFSSTDIEIQSFIKSKKIKNAIICDYKEDTSVIMNLFRYTIIIPKKQISFTSTQHLKDIAGIIGFSSTHNLTFKHNLFFKRTIDILLILVASPIIIPVMIILALLTKLTSKGPIFYGHTRIGKNGKSFKCWKFRSMCINSQEILNQILETDPQMRAEWEKDHKFLNDPRITKFGKFLRKTSLDELPQLINIFIGQMSFVGPRPVTDEELFKYGDMKDYVLSVTPGLSGLWQVSGRSDTGYEERISFDTYYIQNWSIWLDIWIIIKTIWVVLNHKGAY